MSGKKQKQELKSTRDPLEDFWAKEVKQFPKLSKVAMSLLVIPATSAPAERIFSQCSLATSGRRGKLEGFNLKREVMLEVNSAFV